MFHSNAMFASGLVILIMSNLSECDKSAAIDSNTNESLRLLLRNREDSVLSRQLRLLSSDQQAACCSCTKNCAHTRSGSLNTQIDGLIQNEDAMDVSGEGRSVLVDKRTFPSVSLKKHSKRMDVQSSIRTLLSRLRPETPLSAFGYTHPPPYSQMNYAPIASAYSYAGYRPALSNLGVSYGLDVSPGYSDFTPYISTGLGSNLGTPYGTGLGIGSSFGIYDNFYPNSFGTSKSTMLRRKLVPQEGVLLLEVEDPLNDPRETLPLTSSRHIAKVALGRTGNNENHQTNFGSPKFSIHLTSSPPNELNPEGTNRDLAFNLLSLAGGPLAIKQSKPNLASENLANLDELSRNPHLSKLDRQANQKIRILSS